MSLWSDILNDALVEINVYSLFDTVQTVDQNFAVRRLNRILDSWAARRVLAYSTTFATYTLTPAHSPNLIGPGLTSPDFGTPNSAARPTRIESAELILTDVTPNVDVPINIRDAAWWANNRVKQLSTNVPTDLYYEPDPVNGSLYFWPIPSFAYGVRLELWTTVGQVPTNLATTFYAPQGYELALTLTLAENLAAGYEKPVPAQLAKQASDARNALFRALARSPRVPSADAGTSGKPRGDFNYESGLPT